MIPIGGMSAGTGLALLDATKDKSLALIRSSAQHERAISQFREKIADVSSIDDLMKDQDLYAFVMRAHDLEDQIFGKALIRKMLTSDVTDRKSLVNRLTDQRFKDMHADMGFSPSGAASGDFSDPAWQQKMIDRYVTRQYINAGEEQNETVGRVLEFREKVAGVRNVFDILKDKDLSTVLRTALGIPEATAGLDIDKQAEILERKLDLADLKDPKELDRLVRTYVTISDATSGQSTQNNAALQLLSGMNSGGGDFLPVTIDIAAITALPRRPYA